MDSPPFVTAGLRAVAVLILLLVFSPAALAWGGLGHRTVAAIAMQLLPPAKVQAMNKLLAQLKMDGDFIDAASYPDQWIRNHDPSHKFNLWRYADLPDDGTLFVCGECLFEAPPAQLAIEGGGGKGEAMAIAWVEHLVGDLHQPLHMDGRERGGNDFAVLYRGHKTCPSWSFTAGKMERVKVELHSVWDDCLVQELADDRSPEELAKVLLGNIRTYRGRREIRGVPRQPWIAWGKESHALALSAAFDHLAEGVDLNDAYIIGDGNSALAVVRRQLLVAGIRLAFLLDQNFGSHQP
jgi:hypothetical protein